MCTGTAYTDQSRHVGSSRTVFNDENDFGANYNKIATNYNSVRCVLLLPSPTFNLNSIQRNKESQSHGHDFSAQNAWNHNHGNFEDEDNNFSEDEMELNFNEFNVKISGNHDDDGYHHQRSRKLKDRKGWNKNKNYHDNEFWILSGTSNGSMLLHKLNNDGTDNDDINGSDGSYGNYL